MPGKVDSESFSKKKVRVSTRKKNRLRLKTISPWKLMITNAMVVLDCLGCQGRILGGKVLLRFSRTSQHTKRFYNAAENAVLFSIFGIKSAESYEEE